MEHELELGLLGRLMDLLGVGRKWDAGIEGFFAGLKRHGESGGGAVGPGALRTSGAPARLRGRRAGR